MVWCNGNGHSEGVKVDANETIEVVGGQSSSGDDWRLRAVKAEMDLSRVSTPPKSLIYWYSCTQEHRTCR